MAILFNLANLVYIELRHLDVLHFVTEECRHLVNGCTAKCDCIGLMLFCYLSCFGHNNMRCDINTVGFVRAESMMHVVQPFTRRRHCPQTKWTSHVK